MARWAPTAATRRRGSSTCCPSSTPTWSRLQEVPLQQTHDTFLADLERATGYHVVAGPLFTRRGTDFGNAVLSRHAVDRVAHLDLTVDDHEPRGALDVRIRRRRAGFVARPGNASGIASRRTARAGEKAPRRGRERAAAADDPHGRSERMVPVGPSVALAACAFSREAGSAADVSRAASRVRARPDLDLAGGLPAPVALPCESAGAGRIGPSAAPRRSCRLTSAPSRGRYACRYERPDLLQAAANPAAAAGNRSRQVGCHRLRSAHVGTRLLGTGRARSRRRALDVASDLPRGVSRRAGRRLTHRPHPGRDAQLPLRRNVRRARGRPFMSSERSAIESAAV